MIGLYIDLDYLDIFVEALEMTKKLLSICFHSLHKDLSAISRSPDDVVFGLIYRMRALSEPHTIIIPYLATSSGLPIHHQTESDGLTAY